MPMDVLNFTGLGLGFVLVTTDFYLAIMFLLKIKRAWKSAIDLSPFLGLTLFFLFFGVSRIFFIYGDYNYLQFGTESVFLWKGAYLSGFIGVIGLIFLSEKMLGKTKYGFTIFSLICTIYGFFFLGTIDQLRWFSYITLPIGMLVVLANLSISLILKASGIIRRRMGMALLFLIIFGFFIFLNTVLGQEIMLSVLKVPEEITKIISEAGIIAFSILFGLCFLTFETFTEFGWREKLKELFIIAPNGATLFYYSFIKKTELRDPDLITSGLTGVKGILAEMMQSNRVLKVVDHQDVKIIFEYGTYATLALISSENLNIYHSKLATLIKQFENLFQDVLAHWVGETEVFLPTKRLIEDLFD